MNDEAIDVIRRQLGKHQIRVFTFKGKPVCTINTRAWKRALRRAGITAFRWHDLRHTWASWHVQAGTPIYELEELGGWESVEMVRRSLISRPSSSKERPPRILPLGTKLAAVAETASGKTA